MRKLEQVLAIVEADRQLSAQSPLLEEWRCGAVTVAVDASRRVIVRADEPRAVVGDVAAFISALSRAERFADDAGKSRAAS